MTIIVPLNVDNREKNLQLRHCASNQILQVTVDANTLKAEDYTKAEDLGDNWGNIYFCRYWKINKARIEKFSHINKTKNSRLPSIGQRYEIRPQWRDSGWMPKTNATRIFKMCMQFFLRLEEFFDTNSDSSLFWKTIHKVGGASNTYYFDTVNNTIHRQFNLENLSSGTRKEQQ